MPGLNLSTQIAFLCRGFLLLLGVMAGNCSGFPGPGFRSHCQTLGSSGSTVETEWNWPLKVLWHSVSVLCSLLKLSANPNLWHSVALSFASSFLITCQHVWLFYQYEKQGSGKSHFLPLCLSHYTLRVSQANVILKKPYPNEFFKA